MNLEKARSLTSFSFVSQMANSLVNWTLLLREIYQIIRRTGSKMQACKNENSSGKSHLVYLSLLEFLQQFWQHWRETPSINFPSDLGIYWYDSWWRCNRLPEDVERKLLRSLC